MKSRLMRINNWPGLAQAVAYVVSGVCSRHKVSIREGERFTLWRLGITPHMLFTHFRMSRALWLLRETDLNVKEIAKQVCYETASCFSREFKRFHGFSPKDAWDGRASASPFMAESRVQHSIGGRGSVGVRSGFKKA